MKKIILKTLFLLGITSYAQTNIITINPNDVKQSVTFGGDNKLTVKDWAEKQTDAVSRQLFQDMNLKILRVPIFALQPITHDLYDNVITVINSVKSYNPDVKIFASIANGDGLGNNFHNASKFPSGWTGCCPANVYSLNLTAYSAYLDSFMQRMTDAGITIDYLGPYNEDPGDNSDYFKIIDQMTKLGNTEMVGLERFALGASIDDVLELEDQVTIVGSHFYDDGDIPESNWDSTWSELVNKSKNPVWYTEATRYSNPDGLELLIAGMDNIFAPIRGGVDTVIFYQVCKRFVFANGNKLPIKYSGFQNIVNNSEGKVITSNSNNSNVKLVVFGNGNTLDAHIINNDTNDITFDLQLLNTFLGNGSVTKKEWTASQTTGATSTYTLTNNSNWNITVPATSYSHHKITLNKSILSNNDVTFNNENIKIYPNPTNGHFQISLPKNIKEEEVKIKIFTIQGKEVYSKAQHYDSNIMLNQNLPSGIYLISITLNNYVYNNKIIVEK